MNLIIGNINEVASGFCKYSPAIQEALHFLHKQDFTKMKDGKYPINGDNSYAMLQRYATRVPESGKPEAHRQYIDVQYIVEGSEEMGWCPLSPELVVAEQYDAQRDVVFYHALIPESTVILQEGCFAVLYPADVHRPCGALETGSAPVTKVVVKIAVDYVK